MRSFRVTLFVHAPVATVYGLLDDGANWDRWGRPLIRTSAWAPGSPAGGAGSVRQIGSLVGTFRERVLEADEIHLHAYTIEGPMPIRNYRADVRLTELGGSRTQIDWDVQFRPVVPGTGPVLSTALRVMIRFLGRRLAAESVRVRSASRE